MSSPTSLPAECPRCGANLHPAVVKTTQWVGEDLYAFEDVPAQMCDSCGAQFLNEKTTAALRRFAANPAQAKPMHQILVSVFSLKDYIKP